MPKYVVRVILQRALLPTVIAACSLVRPVGISLVYLLFFTLVPYVPIANKKNMKGKVGAYFMILIIVVILLIITHLLLQILVLFLGREGFLEQCKFLEIFLMHIGFFSFDQMSVWSIIHVISPDIVMLVMSVTMYLLLKTLVLKMSNSDFGSQNLPNEPLVEEGIKLHTKTEYLSQGKSDNIEKIGCFLSLFTLFIASALRPSLPGGIYFIVFLGASTCWACVKPLKKNFAIILRAVMVVLIIHAATIISYQTPLAQNFLQNSSLPARLLALESLFISNCSSVPHNPIHWNTSLNFDSFLNPAAIYLCYYTLALSSKYIFKNKIAKPTIRHDKRYFKSRMAINRQVGITEEDPNLTIIDQIWLILESVGNLIYKHCFVLANITMMVWSIVYHSWLTFVLLIGSNLLWIIPNQKKTMLRTSPFIVLYVELLLVAQYIYSMQLTDSELPTQVDTPGINLKQIGLIKPESLPWKDLSVKTLFATIFWITLRQLLKETNKKRLSTSLVETDLSSFGQDSQLYKKTNKALLIFEKTGNFIKSILVKLWIWMLISVIFLSSMMGERMTTFRICYMALFLFFVLTFQLSWRAWTRIMYGFWIFLIGYEMSILILVYTYQFDNFDEYLKNYFNLSLILQRDIGLEKYETKDLFLHLLMPTIIVIMTVIQVHYFHRNFLNSLQVVRQPIVSASGTTSTNVGEHEETLINSTNPTSEVAEEKIKSDTSNEETKKLKQTLKESLKSFSKLFIESCWIFCELHTIKLIYILAFVISLKNLVALHIPIVFFAIGGILVKRKWSIAISLLISVMVSFFILGQMVYQIDYIKPSQNNLCSNKSYMKNLDEWYGLQKYTMKNAFNDLCISYIAYLVITTFHAVVIFRQSQSRIANSMPNHILQVIYPNITRKHADENSTNLFKYLMNYSYFKFGIEISLISMVTLISGRRDIIALIYSLWLCGIFMCKRTTCAKIWPALKWFITLGTIAQYLIIIFSLLPICEAYLWEELDLIDELFYKLFIPGPKLVHVKWKLMYDFVLLILICRQSKVFALEAKIKKENIDYPGGSNVECMNEKDTFYLSPDFTSHIQNGLDVLKSIFLSAFFWITLAVVFLAGTNVVSIFSIGYLVGSFIFLWQGTDFYLRPVNVILKWWHILLIYNVIIITLRTALNIPICLFKSIIEGNACWAIHFLGIICDNNSDFKNKVDNVSTCEPVSETSAVMWDAISFAFLLLQLRIFKSHYFRHMINETKAKHILESRGAELIEKLRKKQIEFKIEYEREVLHKIKTKMERIRETQQKLLQPKDRPTHSNEFDTRNSKKKKLQKHADAIRAGDYYMFDDLKQKVDLDLMNETTDFLDDESEPKVLSESTKEDEQGEKQPETENEDIKDEKSLSKGKEPDGENFILKVLKSISKSLLSNLNKLSRNYRYVMKILTEEKKILKESKHFKAAGSNDEWHLLKASKDMEQSNAVLFETFDKDIPPKERSIIVQLLIAIWYLILSYTEILCYFVIFVNQIYSASLLSLPLPCLVFFWGALTLPRPSKTFWITIIAYTQAVVLVKCLFQFKIIWFNRLNTKDPLSPATIVGIEFQENYATCDLILLLTLFFHRFILKSQGLWRTEDKYNTPNSESNIHYQVAGPSNIEFDKSRQTLQMEKNEIYEDIPNIGKMKSSKYFSPPIVFFRNLLTKPRLPSDVYWAMFLCDFINFFVLLFGFTAFGSRQSDGGVQTYIQENKVPIPFLIMLLIQFLLILIDRALYLRKALRLKILFHFASVIGIHVWMFFLVPLVTDKRFNSHLLPMMFYLIKCIYLLLSSYQIRCGYPNRILGNFLTRGFSIINLIAFKVYMTMPFLYELRTFMDWVCIDTTMTLFEWLKMGDIFANVFFLKCFRQMEKDFPVERAEKRTTLVKIALGGTYIILLIILLWAPLALFALGNTVGISSIPCDLSISLRIGSYEPIYKMSAQDSSIFQFDDQSWKSFQIPFKQNKYAPALLSAYTHDDVAAVTLGTNSGSIWNISPQDKNRLLGDLIGNKTITFRFKYTVTRLLNDNDNLGITSGISVYEMFPQNSERSKLIATLEGRTKNETILLPNLFPKFLKVRNSRSLKAFDDLTPDNSVFRNITIKFITSESKSGQDSWKAEEVCNDTFYKTTLLPLPLSNCEKNLVVYTFNDKIFPSSFNFLTAGGIIGMYTTFVIVAARFLRSITSGQSKRIMFEELPYVDRILQLCFDIYLVREAKEFALEEDLYAKLLFLYRSPETMIKWSRCNEDVDEDSPKDIIRR